MKNSIFVYSKKFPRVLRKITRLMKNNLVRKLDIFRSVNIVFVSRVARTKNKFVINVTIFRDVAVVIPKFCPGRKSTGLLQSPMELKRYGNVNPFSNYFAGFVDECV